MADIFQKSDDALGEATGMFQNKIRGRAKNFFGTSAQTDQAMALSHRVSGNMMKSSIQTFGMQALMQGDKFFEQSAITIDKQLKDARDEAIRMRQEGNMASYQRAMQRQLEAKRMKQELAIAKKANFGNFWIGIGTAAASIFGAIIGTLIVPGAGTAVGAGIGAGLVSSLSPNPGYPGADS